MDNSSVFNLFVKLAKGVELSEELKNKIKNAVMEHIVVKWAWKGPPALDIRPCVLAPLYKLPVIEVIEGVYILTDLTIPCGEVVYDYLEG